MKRTQAAAAVAALALLPGCMVWMESRSPARAEYDIGARPVTSYYCYDCHGYRYFDPYYDWCVSYGFRYAWGRHPEAVEVYRQRYVQIKEENPRYGHYRYPGDYWQARRYRQPRDYDEWRLGAGASKPSRTGDLNVREKARHDPGSYRKKQKERRDRHQRPPEPPRDTRPPGGQRPGSPGGE